MGVGNKRTLTKTRRKTRDLDQIISDLRSAKHLTQYKNTKLSQDLPGLGKNYCVACSRWFDAPSTLTAHERGKPHKRRLKQLREESGQSKSLSTNKSSQVENTTVDTGVEMAL
ncbi:hypothetical protein FP744_10000979 [Trichoderma asperellum]|nr:hypothetical protein LI328DRAFT_47220 [Trichoderma asperelloides]